MSKADLFGARSRSPMACQHINGERREVATIRKTGDGPPKVAWMEHDCLAQVMSRKESNYHVSKTYQQSPALLVMNPEQQSGVWKVFGPVEWPEPHGPWRPSLRIKTRPKTIPTRTKMSRNPGPTVHTPTHAMRKYTGSTLAEIALPGDIPGLVTPEVFTPTAPSSSPSLPSLQTPSLQRTGTPFLKPAIALCKGTDEHVSDKEDDLYNYGCRTWETTAMMLMSLPRSHHFASSARSTPPRRFSIHVKITPSRGSHPKRRSYPAHITRPMAGHPRDNRKTLVQRPIRPTQAQINRTQKEERSSYKHDQSGSATTYETQH